MTVDLCNKHNIESLYLLNLKLDLVFRYEIFSSPDAVAIQWNLFLCFWIILSHTFMHFSPLFSWPFFAWPWSQSLAVGRICRTIGPVLLKLSVTILVVIFGEWLMTDRLWHPTLPNFNYIVITVCGDTKDGAYEVPQFNTVALCSLS
jgi:hypothetical protein